MSDMQVELLGRILLVVCIVWTSFELYDARQTAQAWRARAVAAEARLQELQKAE